MRVQHFDRIAVRFDRTTLRTNADKSRTVDGFGAHVGNYTYHDDKGRPFVEHVPAETLFDAASLDSAAGSTLTIRHGPGLVTPDRYRAEAHGSWVKAWDAGDGNLGVRLRLGSTEALSFVSKAMDAGEAIELSPVYEVDVLDRPGRTEHGRHDAVQDGRMYSGIALLGPNEARGGSGMRLQLDGPECAPEGSRIQVHNERLDSAADPRLQSVSKDRATMKNAIISSKGRRRAVSLDTLKSVRAQKIDATNADQIETGTLTVEIEGEEPAVLVLPVSMIEMLLEGIGATSAPAAPEAPIEEVEQVEGIDADDDEKMDAKTVNALIDKRLKSHSDARDKAEARRASVHGDAARCLPPAYDYERAGSWQQWALDAVARVSPNDEAHAKRLATDSLAGDAEASGGLRQLLKSASANVVAPKVNMTQADNKDAAPAPWTAPVMPKAEVKQ